MAVEYFWNSYKLSIGILQQFCYQLVFTGIFGNSLEILTTGFQNGELIWWILVGIESFSVYLMSQTLKKKKIFFNSFLLSQNIQRHLFHQEFILLTVFNWSNLMAQEYFQNSYKLPIGETRWIWELSQNSEIHQGFFRILEFFQNSTRQFQNSLTFLLLSAFHLTYHLIWKR